MANINLIPYKRIAWETMVPADMSLICLMDQCSAKNLNLGDHHLKLEDRQSILKLKGLGF